MVKKILAGHGILTHDVPTLAVWTAINARFISCHCSVPNCVSVEILFFDSFKNDVHHKNLMI